MSHNHEKRFVISPWSAVKFTINGWMYNGRHPNLFHVPFYDRTRLYLDISSRALSCFLNSRTTLRGPKGRRIKRVLMEIDLIVYSPWYCWGWSVEEGDEDCTSLYLWDGALSDGMERTTPWFFLVNFHCQFSAYSLIKAPMALTSRQSHVLTVCQRLFCQLDWWQYVLMYSQSNSDSLDKGQSSYLHAVQRRYAGVQSHT